MSIPEQFVLRLIHLAYALLWYGEWVAALDALLRATLMLSAIRRH